jgi:hypothetical protein
MRFDIFLLLSVLEDCHYVFQSHLLMSSLMPLLNSCTQGDLLSMEVYFVFKLNKKLFFNHKYLDYEEIDAAKWCPEVERYFGNYIMEIIDEKRQLPSKLVVTQINTNYF